MRTTAEKWIGSAEATCGSPSFADVSLGELDEVSVEATFLMDNFSICSLYLSLWLLYTLPFLFSFSNFLGCLCALPVSLSRLFYIKHFNLYSFLLSFTFPMCCKVLWQVVFFSSKYSVIPIRSCSFFMVHYFVCALSMCVCKHVLINHIIKA